MTPTYTASQKKTNVVHETADDLDKFIGVYFTSIRSAIAQQLNIYSSTE